jgi:hypothetical protein
MNPFKLLSIAVLTLTLYGCATTTGGIGKYGEDLDVNTCEGADKVLAPIQYEREFYKQSA